jgi:hypothetical protein
MALDLEKMFQPRVLRDEDAAKVQAVGDGFYKFVKELDGNIPDGPEKTLMFRSVHDAMGHAFDAISWSAPD